MSDRYADAKEIARTVIVNCAILKNADLRKKGEASDRYQLAVTVLRMDKDLSEAEGAYVAASSKGSQGGRA